MFVSFNQFSIGLSDPELPWILSLMNFTWYKSSCKSFNKSLFTMTILTILTILMPSCNFTIPASLHALTEWGIRLRTDVRKATLRGFSRRKQELKFANTSNLGSGLFILDNRKWTTFYRKDDNGKLLVEVIIQYIFGSSSDSRCLRCK